VSDKPKVRPTAEDGAKILDLIAALKESLDKKARQPRAEGEIAP
jgi:hypothetical protein